MAVSFNAIPSDLRVPLFYAEIDNSQAGYSQQAQRTLLIGPMLASGTAVPGRPLPVAAAAQAAALFGAGSILASMVATYRAGDDTGQLWCLPLADPAGAVAAAGTVTFAGMAAESGTLALYVAGSRVTVPVAAGAAAAALAPLLIAAINAAALPVTAAADGAATLRLTARHGGAIGNDIDLRINHRGAAGGESVPAGLTVTVTAMAGGAGLPDLAAALAGLGDEEYDFVALPWTDTAALDAVQAEWGPETGRWSWSQQVYGHVFAARGGTLGQLSAFGAARNDPHISIMAYPAGAGGSPSAPWSWAAAVTAAAARSLKADPARPLQTLTLPGILAPSQPFIRAERQVLLWDGMATHMVGADGTVMIERLVTTYQRNAYGQTEPSYLDVETLATLWTVLRRLRSAVTTKYGRHKLASDGTRFGAGQAIVTTAVIKAEQVAQYAQMEEEGLVENTAAFARALIVERAADNPNRVNVLYPPDLVNQLRIFAVKVQFRL